MIAQKLRKKKEMQVSTSSLQNAGILHFCLLVVALTFLFGTSVAAEEIIVAPGDNLQVYIPGSQQVEQVYVVGIDGHIDLGVYGRLKVAGYGLKDAEGLLKKHLSKYLKSTAGISLLLKHRSRMVLITGCVQKPGVVAIEPRDDLWQALHRADGLAPCADVSRITFFRDGQELDVDLHAYLTRDAKEPLPQLMSGDTIFVPSGPGMAPGQNVVESFLGHEALRRKVFLLGAVTSPGMYTLTPGLDILTLVAAANGPAANADLSHTIVLTKQESVTIDLHQELVGKQMDRHLLPKEGGVIIYVPSLEENLDVRFGEHINVLGAFNQTGRKRVSGPIKLIDAIGLAGGFSDGAKTRKLRVVEEGPGYTLVTKYNLKRYLKNGGAVGRVMVKPGSTIMLGSVNREALTITMSILGTVSMISSTYLLWINYASALQGG